MSEQGDLEDDDVLADRLLSGDQQAVEYLLKSLDEQLRRLAWAYGRAKQKADEDDFIQDFMLRFISNKWRTLNNWKAERKVRLKSYLFGAAANMAITTGRKRQKDGNNVEINEDAVSVSDGFDSEARLVARLDAGRVIEMLESIHLPPLQRLVFTRERREISKEQTLAETGMRAQNYEQHLSRARVTVQEQLRKAGLR